MCGIVAYIGNKNAAKILMQGLEILQNRGYDSAGLATIFNGNYIISKEASKNTTSDSIEILKTLLHKHEGTVGIGHTRWATHGPKTRKNAHPHLDNDKRFCIVHNGVIENFKELKKYLHDHDVKCASDTDTEIIVQLLNLNMLNNNNSDDVLKCLKTTLNMLEGTWGLVLLDRETPNILYVVKHGSPMLIGLGKDEVFVGSEMAAFQNYTNKYFSMNNGEIIVIRNRNNIDDMDDNKIDIKTSSVDSYNLNDRIRLVEKEKILLSPKPYKHWTIKEIHDQVETINSALNNGGRIKSDCEVILGGLSQNKEKLLKIKDLIIIGCGTSLHAGKYISNIMRNISGFKTIQVVDASEFNLSYISNLKHSGLLLISQSGETKDVSRCLELLAGFDNIPVFSVINRVGSHISRMTGCGVYLNAGREVAVASTKAFTSQITVLTLISIWFSQERKLCKNSRIELIGDLRRLSNCFKTVLYNCVEKCKAIAKFLQNKNNCFVLGKGLGAYIAYEGALKIKEISYIHAEGCPGGSLKHGPFALIDENTPIIVILLDDEHKSYMLSTIQEIKSRGAKVIIITNCTSFLNNNDNNNNDYDDHEYIINIPSNGTLTSLLSIVPLQIISYELSILKGINPDKPRNLAKTVTVI